jgi:hypothetical protein
MKGWLEAIFLIAGRAKMPRYARLLVSVIALAAYGGALAETTSPASDAGPQNVRGIVPAGTLVAIRVDENLSSKTAKRGDKFEISLMNDVWVGDKIALPMGTKGVGEVIHASGKGFGGRAGELIVTARYLEHEGRQIRLGNFKLSAAGADNATAAMLATTAVPIIGLFVTGTSAYIGLGQLAQAKLTEDFTFALERTSTTTAQEPAIQGENE